MTRIGAESSLSAPHLGPQRQDQAGPGFSLAFQQAIAAALGEELAAGAGPAADAEPDPALGAGHKGRGEPGKATHLEAEAKRPGDPRSRIDISDLLLTPRRGATGETGERTPRANAVDALAKITARLDERYGTLSRIRDGREAADPSRADVHHGAFGPFDGDPDAMAGGDQPRTPGRAPSPQALERAAERARETRAGETPNVAGAAAATAASAETAARAAAPRLDPVQEARTTVRARLRTMTGSAANDARTLTGPGEATTPGAGARAAAKDGPLTADMRLRTMASVRAVDQALRAGAVAAEAETASPTAKAEPRQQAERGASHDAPGRPHLSRAEMIGNVTPYAADDLAAEQRRRMPAFRAEERHAASEQLNTTVTRRETHFAPVMMPQRSGGLPLGQSIGIDTAPPMDDSGGTPADGRAATDQLGRLIERTLPELRAALDGRAPSQMQAASQVAKAQPPQSAGPVRVVEIQLQPAALGSLTVTMRLSGSGLKVSVVASVKETAARLSEDRSELTQLIRRAGYEASEITVEAASAPSGGGEGEGDASAGGGGRRGGFFYTPDDEPAPPRGTVTETRTSRSVNV
ncbi:hypothetical protein ATO13_02945 [Stappia sp. 22II-S9-Z10]|nr:hypothetical protein ATO13_02945 [Stappia sp. 22II-S9-Z10]